MAELSSFVSFGLDNFDKYPVYAGLITNSFYDDAYSALNGATYQDILAVYWSNGEFVAFTAFGGTGITLEPSGITGGTVTGLLVYINGYGFIWELRDVSISAKALWEAAKTLNPSDEIALFTNALAGNDTINMSIYDDNAYGFAGNDTMKGNDGSDILYGGAGNDVMTGDKGNDTLDGGLGKDQLTGGLGGDRFVFGATGESGYVANTADLISDYVKGSDKVDLSAIDAYAASGSNDAFIWRGVAGFSDASAGEVRYQKFDNAGKRNDYTMVFVDTDGDINAEMGIRLKGLIALSASDFIL